LTRTDSLEVTGQATDKAEPAARLEFRAVFERYSPYVATIAFRILGRDDEVDDVVQDVFLQVHRRLHTIQVPAVRAWLAIATVRATRRRLRRRWVWRALGFDGTGDELIDPKASPEQRAHVGSVARLLDHMPADDRIAWVLRHLEDKTLEETAELCGCSVSTVQRRLRAAKSYLDRTGAK
jgi:RNA polymerase sigma-70 factor (ECF subfamily)